MFIKLLPEQLVKFWDLMRFAIAETFEQRSACTNEHLRFILANLLSGRSQCWVGFKMVEGERKFVGFLLTRINVDAFINERTLVVDHIYAFQGIPDELLFSGQKILDNFARANKCTSLIATTHNERVVKFAQRAGYRNCFLLIKEV